MMTTLSFSDSQVSALYGSDVLEEIKDHIDIDNLPILEEEVMPVQEAKYEMPEPSPGSITSNQQMPMDRQFAHTMNIPIKEEFPGFYNFEVKLNTPHKAKSYVYSTILRKVFIDMEQRLPVRVLWQPTYDGLWLRAMVIFSEDQHRSTPVARCHNHTAMNSTSNHNVAPHILKHVIRCEHPHSFYEDHNGHMSVSVPLGSPQPGCSYIPLDFQFYCKNSCSSGMNRRATEIVFTLETDQREVIGRRSIKCRVCSCPKRDKEKEETETQEIRVGGKKRKLNSIRQQPPQPPPGKKLMNPIIQRDNNEYTLQLKIPGLENLRSIVKIAHDILAGDAARTGDYQRMAPYLEELQRKLNGISQ